MNPMLISLAVFLTVTLLIAALAFLFGGDASTRVEDRLQVLAGLKAPEIASRGLLKEEVFREGLSGITGLLNGLAKRVGNLERLFEQADSPISSSTFFALSAAFGLLGAAAGVLSRAPVPLYPVFALAAGTAPLGWLWWRRRTRMKKFARQMPDALELVARALRSGHSLASGMHVVAEELPAPIATEFAMVFEAQNLGIPIEQAMKDMHRRVPNMDLKFFVTSVVIQRQTGGDMAEILDKIGHIVRERFKILGQVQALTGEGRISGIVLMGLPIALFFAVYFMNPAYMMLLFTDPLGKKMIAVAAVLQVLGAITIKKIVNIKV